MIIGSLQSSLTYIIVGENKMSLSPLLFASPRQFPLSSRHVLFWRWDSTDTTDSKKSLSLAHHLIIIFRELSISRLSFASTTTTLAPILVSQNVCPSRRTQYIALRYVRWRHPWQGAPLSFFEADRPVNYKLSLISLYHHHHHHHHHHHV
jgi:hypothetical protein